MAEGFKELKEKYLRQMQEMYAARPERGGQQEVERELAKKAEGDAIEGTAEEEQELPEEGNPVFLGAVAAGETVQLPQPPGLADIPLPSDSAPPPPPDIFNETEALNPNPEPDQPSDEAGEGRLLVKVVTARGALPVPQARVVISREIAGKRTLQGYDETDESGQSRVFTLSAPSASLSMSPDNKTPYARYIVTVSAEGYIPAEYRNVPVFDGIQSVQQADIQPLLEGQSGEMQSYGGASQQGVETDSPGGYRKEGTVN